jgi:hypothetical protein
VALALSGGLVVVLSATASPGAYAGTTSSRTVRTSVVAVSVPGAPQNLSAVPQDGGLLAGFQAPLDNGGATVTGFEYSLDGQTWSTAHPMTNGPWNVLELHGLENLRRYVVRVRAVNEAGAGAVATAAAVIPYSGSAPQVPGAPTQVRVEPLDGGMWVRFNAPADNGGAMVVGYQASTDGGSTWSDVSILDSNPLIFGLGGLRNGTSYSVLVRAVNVVGSGATGSAPAAVPFHPADAPTVTAVAPGDGQLTVSFAGPADDGGIPVTGYQASTDGGASWVAAPTLGTGPYTTTVGGLHNGSSYAVLLRAVTAGPGAAATAPAATPVAAPPVAGPDPTISAALSSASVRSRYGWYRTPVTISFRCATTGAPLATACPAPVLVARQGRHEAFSRTVTATDGGRATVDVEGIALDRTAPRVSLSHRASSVRFRPVWTCAPSDVLSGVAGCRVSAAYHRGRVHVRARVTVRATDRAGNRTVLHATYWSSSRGYHRTSSRTSH